MAPDTASVTTNTRFGFSRSRQAYWEPELLSSFTFLMAGHGSPVCASMMIGDPEYARGQLRLACTYDDQALQQIAVEMLSSFAALKPRFH